MVIYRGHLTVSLETRVAIVWVAVSFVARYVFRYGLYVIRGRIGTSVCRYIYLDALDSSFSDW